MRAQGAWPRKSRVAAEACCVYIRVRLHFVHCRVRPMDRLLRIALDRLIRSGNVEVTTAAGSTFTVGDGTGPQLAVRIRTRAVQLGLLFDPELKFGEAYMDGALVVEQGSIADVLALVLGQQRGRLVPKAHPFWLSRYVRRRLQQFNPRKRARRNVAHHYELSPEFFSLFLDADLQYSCGYFEHPHQSLEQAQLAKKRHIAAKLLIASGQRVLDVGCGWGGLGLYLAQVLNANVTGITLAQQQQEVAQTRAAEKHLTNKIDFRLQDYRDLTEKFERIVSVGMFEHVGVGFYDRFFRTCHQVLDDSGIMLLHSIGRAAGPDITNPWMAKYVFPGGYIPA